MVSRKPDILILLYFLLVLVCSAFLPTWEQFPGGTPPPTKQEESKNRKKVNRQHERTFKWANIRGQKIEATLNIPDSSLKKELRDFGKPRGRIHPMLLPSRGFKVIGRRHVVQGSRIVEHFSYVVDYKAIYEKNLKYFRPISKDIMDAIRQKNPTGILYPLLRFTQFIKYKLPPRYYKSKDINSFFTPLVCLYEQYGDCDSKSVLLADILSTVSDEIKPSLGMILIRGRGIAHAVLAVKADLLPGMTAVYVRGEGYYLALETTSPGWTPGFIAPRLTNAITSGYFSFLKLN